MRASRIFVKSCNVEKENIISTEEEYDVKDVTRADHTNLGCLTCGTSPRNVSQICSK